MKHTVKQQGIISVSFGAMVSDPFARKNANAGYKTDKQRHEEDIAASTQRGKDRAKADAAKKSAEDAATKRNVYKPQLPMKE